ncbi:terpene synthase family protein [Segniliparus rugosus]|uniref:Terpene synthase n=1 Tax=Segniliparus rugosus (strain ATCC BAA-974 / DSM 45345 / CCUG 50838 / CIP 108380 / JCM 13579 / CDC 945) TaxID=679197 RepID=E5XM62_SEGRC|nr:terpene synthase family protein [Segniliparus rugosus]EFV14552.1 hypothetical protein HMPREF9336_00582 [Segniliparus rugosus ATCC BAA-974]
MPTSRNVAAISAPPEHLLGNSDTWPLRVTFDELRVRLPSARLHPAADEQDVRGARFCQLHLAALFETEDAFADFTGARHHHAALYGLPLALPDRIGPICDMLQLMFVVDDILDSATMEKRSAANFRADMAALLKGFSLEGDGPARRVAQAMSHVIGELLATGMSQRHVDCLLADMAAHAESCLRENTSKLHDEINDIDSYRRTHASVGGVPVVLRLLEYSLGVDIGAEQQESTLLRDISQVVNWHMMHVNSLFSFRKEMFEENNATNLVLVLARRQGMSVQAAADAVCDEIRATEAAYYRLRDEAFDHPFSDQEAVRRYLIGLDYLLSGTIAFHAVNPRYHGVAGLWLAEEPVAATMHIYPDRTVFTPASRHASEGR